MICASCTASLDQPAKTCLVCGYPALLLERFQLVSQLSCGESGPLYLAVDAEGDRLVVIRVVELSGLSEREQVEACDAAYASLHGVSIPGLAFWRDRHIAGRGRNRTLYAVQDHAEGAPLSALCPPLPAGEVLGLLDELLAVLEVMRDHTPPLAHLDLKPQNVLRQRGGLVLVDAGGARDVLIAARAAAGRQPAGTRWLAPEQHLGLGGPASDLYAAALLACYLLSGRPPDPLAPARALEDLELSPQQRRVLQEMLATDPADRPDSIADIRVRLRPPAPAGKRPRPAPPALASAGPSEAPRGAARAVAGAAATLGATAAAGVLGGPLAAGVTGAFSALAVAIALRSRPSSAPAWQAPEWIDTATAEDLFREALEALEEAYPTPPPSVVRIRGYIEARDYGALRVDFFRLRSELTRRHSAVPPQVEASLERLRVLSQLRS